MIRIEESKLTGYKVAVGSVDTFDDFEKALGKDVDAREVLGTLRREDPERWTEYKRRVGMND